MALVFGLVAVGAAQSAHAQRGRAAAPAAPAALAGRWEGTFTNDVTQKGGRLVLTLTGADESASGQLQLTPMGAKAPVMAEGAGMSMGKGRPTGLPVMAMKSGEDKVSGSVDAAYTDPGCNCTVVTTFEGTITGSTLSGSLAARDSKTGQWNFTSFTATKRAGR
ncbi:MAG: hypothetical protein HY560_09125 [Gemmatimonadetes bacterium]|nr:hypothetical protein [Gemmatimonadota bacterium]